MIRTPEGVEVIAVQIAGLVARRIVCEAKVGDKLSIGDTYGLIRFGSRLDTYLPAGANVLVDDADSGPWRAKPYWPSCRDQTPRQGAGRSACASCPAP